MSIYIFRKLSLFQYLLWFRILWPLLGFAFIIAGMFLFRGELEEGRPANFRWPVMGTVAGLSFKEESPVQDLIRAGAQDTYANFEKKLSAWNSDSEINEVCRRAGTGIAVKVSPEVAKVYDDAFRIARESGGAFNPLVGNVMKLWGFNGGRVPERAPSEEEIARIPFSLNEASWHDGFICLMSGGMTIDLGAIAKGAAVDAVYDGIRRIHPDEELDLLIDLGGNLRVLGNKKWKTGIRNPFGGGLAGTVVLTNGEAIATSGNYERFVTIGGKRYAHILDGRTGKPVQGMAAVTVIAPTAALADALSTTLFILGADEGRIFLNRYYPDVAALWIPDNPEKREIICSERMKKRFDIIH